MKKYICPMHPDITSREPGTCSKCGMELVEVSVKKDKKSKEHSHEHMNHSMVMSNPKMASNFLRRFFIVSAFLIPLAIFSTPAIKYLGISDFFLRKYLEFGIATIIFFFGLIFFEHAGMEIKMRQYGMMTLVSLGVGAGYLFSAVSTFLPFLNTEFYLEISTLIWVLLFGHFLEAKSSSASGNALHEVAKLLPKNAHLKIKNDIHDVDLISLKVGDIVLVKPGEKVPADGKIVRGKANFNQSHLTGESKPVKKTEKDEVSAGAICVDGAVEIELTRVGESSTIGQIKKLIETAQSTKPRIQKLADKAAKWLTFSALSVSVITLFSWSIFAESSLPFAVTLAIGVLVVACPHALGLAIPTVSTIATKLAVASGVFLKDMAKIETVKDADYVVFDKTGTLTKGNLGVNKIVVTGSKQTEKLKLEILRFAAAIEQYSEHPIASAIVQKAKEKMVKIPRATKFKATAGQGVEGFVGKNKIEVKRPGISVYKNGKLLGSFEMSDEIRLESKATISDLHKLNIKVAMLTGDKKEVGERVAHELGIDKVYSEVLPEDKYKYIRKLQDRGNKVIMVGDGVNDAPALTQANVGVVIGAGTDVAVESGDVILTKNDPESVVSLIVLARKVYKKMLENIFWAAGYNVVAIPAAAGLFIPFGFKLTPSFGALLMSLSSVIVVVNALALKKVSLRLN